MQITLPPRHPGELPVQVEAGKPIVLIGANGSGKTRFGIYVEEKNAPISVHRVSAQKALNIPDHATILNLNQAEKNLFLGRYDMHASPVRKFVDRWGSAPATYLLSDFDKVLTLLFAKSAARDRLYVRESTKSQIYSTPLDSPIEIIVRVWADIMPHRAIAFEDGRVEVQKGTPDEYHGKEMSDGERVALYLLAQCLCAPENSVVIIDEPELHLHRSLMDKLWNKIEELCSTKTLIYITHDLDFAASRCGARKCWIRSYSKDGWVWTDIPEEDSLPESLLLEIIGSRKKILFCEGERGGLDHTIYQRCFPHLHVIPRGGCSQAVDATKTIRGNAALHDFSALGIVDRDVRTDFEIAELEKDGVFVIDFAEVENLLCAEDVVRFAAEKLARDPAEVLATVTQYIVKSLGSELEVQAAIRAERRVRYHFSTFSATSSNLTGLKKGVNSLLSTIDVAAIYKSAEDELTAVLKGGRLNEILKYYNRKKLPERISGYFGLANKEYPTFVLRLLSTADSETLASLLRATLPKL